MKWNSTKDWNCPWQFSKSLTAPVELFPNTRPKSWNLRKNHPPSAKAMIHQRSRTTCSFERALHSYLRARMLQRGACNRLKTIRTISGIVGKRNIDIRNGSLSRRSALCDRQRIEVGLERKKSDREKSLHELLDCSFRSFRTRASLSAYFLFLLGKCTRVSFLLSVWQIALTLIKRFLLFLSSFLPPSPPPSPTSANRKTNLGFSSSLSLLFASAWSRNFQGHANASFSEKLCRVGERLGRELPAKGYRRDYVFLSKRLESRTIRPTCKIPILSKIRRARFYSRNCHIPLSLLAAS